MRKMCSFMKGMITGIAVGAAAAIVTEPVSDRDRRKIARKTEGLFKSVGSVADSIIDIFR